MPQIDFYHLQDVSVSAFLPLLLQRTLDQKQKASVWFKNEETLREASQNLWKYPYPHWLPHGDKNTPCPELQPIWLTTQQDTPNKADFLFLTENCECDRPGDYKRIFYLFDGNNDEECQRAREHWQLAKKHGKPLTYWKKENNKWTYRR